MDVTAWLFVTIIMVVISFFGMRTIAVVASAWTETANAKVKEKEIELKIVEAKKRKE